MKSLVIFIAACSAVWAQDFIHGQYFIHLDETLVQSHSQHEAFVNALKTKYNTDVKRFYNFNSKILLYVHADASDIERVRQLKEVKLTEQNAWAYADQNCLAVSHYGVWGLDRIDQREDLDYTDPYDTDAEYLWGPSDGSGVSVYVFDTGIDIAHYEFEGRAYFDYVADDIANKTIGDFNGHGTHCAGIIASRDHGVAKGATVHAVKVLNENGQGPWSAIIDGLDWLTNLPDRPPASANMAIGGPGQIKAVETAMEALIASGVSIAVSAGNSNDDACTQTPAFVPGAITVGASDIYDEKADFSNYGNCTDIFAPGENIMSTYPNDEERSFSGTSTACPHVAGFAARLLSYIPRTTPDGVHSYMIDTATKDVISDIPTGTGTPNLLLFCDCFSG